MQGKLMTELDIIEVTKLLRLTRVYMQKNTTKEQRNMVKYFDDYTINDKTDKSDGDSDGDLGIKKLVKTKPAKFNTADHPSVKAIEDISGDKECDTLNYRILRNILTIKKEESANTGGVSG